MSCRLSLILLGALFIFSSCASKGYVPHYILTDSKQTEKKSDVNAVDTVIEQDPLPGLPQ